MEIFRFDGKVILPDPNLGFWKGFNDNKISVNTGLTKLQGKLIYLDYINEELINASIAALRKHDSSNYSPVPILFIGLEDLFSGKSNSITEWNYFKKLNIPLYFRFIDCSIWNRYIYFLDENFDRVLNDYIDLIKYLSGHKIFEKPVAKEYIEFYTRLCKESKIENLKGHGAHVAPFVFNSESQMRIESVVSEAINPVIPLNKPSCDKMTFRILLIDDKYKKDCEKDDECKANIIKDLLQLKFDVLLQERVCWKSSAKKDEITVEIHDKDSLYIKDENQNQDIVNSEIIQPSHSKLQIIAVKNLHDAKELLADHRLRFDLIMMDYLLDDKGDNLREYATEFWGDGREHFFNISTKEVEERKRSQEYSDEEAATYLKIQAQYNKIKANRGPMHRLWIFPITAFNQTFIDDLRNKGVRLIDYYWYLSRGADPINTPYLFINSLNKFLQLQLEHAIFDTRKIIGFLEKSIEGIKGIYTLDDFNTFMAAEYTVFMEKYMMRPVIARDMKAGSLFATYVWKEFYAKEERKNLFILTEYINKFYHRCAFGTRGDIEKMITFWRELNSFFLENFSSEQESQNLDLNEYLTVLKRISDRL